MRTNQIRCNKLKSKNTRHSNIEIQPNYTRQYYSVSKVIVEECGMDKY